MNPKTSLLLSKISFFVGAASLAGWLFYFVRWAIFALDTAFFIPLWLYFLAGLLLSAGSLGVVAFVPRARNFHGSAALASVAIAFIQTVFLLIYQGTPSAIVYLLTSGTDGGLQTIAALAALLLAALSFQGMRNTPVFRKPVSDAASADEQALRTPNIASPPTKGYAMIRFLETRALLGLWVITIANLGGGLFLWLFNFLRQIEAEIDWAIFDRRSGREYEEVLESAAVWQLFAVPFIEFGILVLVITLATAAIVSAGNRLAGDKTAL